MAVITGGGTGIGAAIALALAKRNADLCLVGRRLEALEATASKAREYGVSTSCCPADLNSEIDQRDLISRLTTELPQVDILVHNAAIFLPSSVTCGRAEDFDAHYRINVRACYTLTQGLLPMIIARRGQLVFINSSSGLRARSRSIQYDATKHALKAIADSVREEINAAGVRVLSVYLGRTATDMQAKIHELEGRLFRPDLLLQPESVASVVLNALSLPRTAEVTDIIIRPMLKS